MINKLFFFNFIFLKLAPGDGLLGTKSTIVKKTISIVYFLPLGPESRIITV